MMRVRDLDTLDPHTTWMLRPATERPGVDHALWRGVLAGLAIEALCVALVAGPILWGIGWL